MHRPCIWKGLYCWSIWGNSLTQGILQVLVAVKLFVYWPATWKGKELAIFILIHQTRESHESLTPGYPLVSLILALHIITTTMTFAWSQLLWYHLQYLAYNSSIAGVKSEFLLEEGRSLARIHLWQGYSLNLRSWNNNGITPNICSF